MDKVHYLQIILKKKKSVNILYIFATEWRLDHVFQSEAIRSGIGQLITVME